MLDVLSGVYGIMDVAGGAGGVSYLEMKRLPRGSEVDEMIGLRNRKRERERERESGEEIGCLEREGSN